MMRSEGVMIVTESGIVQEINDVHEQQQLAEEEDNIIEYVQYSPDLFFSPSQYRVMVVNESGIVQEINDVHEEQQLAEEDNIIEYDMMRSEGRVRRPYPSQYRVMIVTESGIVQEINDVHEQQQLAEDDNIIHEYVQYSPDLFLGPSIFDEYRSSHRSNDDDNDTGHFDFDFDYDYDDDFTLPFDMDFEYGYGGDGLSEEIILKYLETKRVSSDGISNIVGEICVVCRDELCQLQQNETVIATLDFCGHGYHFDCIKQWLQQKNSCPLCKAQAIIV